MKTDPAERGLLKVHVPHAIVGSGLVETDHAEKEHGKSVAPKAAAFLIHAFSLVVMRSPCFVNRHPISRSNSGKLKTNEPKQYNQRQQNASVQYGKRDK
ncbi:hypothetical protein M514_05596 [Trichuris suis]|uniref:Uncharacterized protein n=1 Tax=Trichuris suis TaxID=68888 RepID=A0A085NQU5_9BILA|nr:hypothetical protein M513_05596 [Trichuris suis]KFD71841.1 hypothetical protein M514_05596 [Trichuris suis]